MDRYTLQKEGCIGNKAKTLSEPYMSQVMIEKKQPIPERRLTEIQGVTDIQGPVGNTGIQGLTGLQGTTMHEMDALYLRRRPFSKYFIQIMAMVCDLLFPLLIFGLLYGFIIEKVVTSHTLSIMVIVGIFTIKAWMKHGIFYSWRSSNIRKFMEN